MADDLITIRFQVETRLELVINYDEDADRSDTAYEVFLAGNVYQVNMLDEREHDVDIQFGDGSVAFAVPKTCFKARDDAVSTDKHKEVVVPLANGWTLRSGVYDRDWNEGHICGEYVRLCDNDGTELGYWDSEEWRKDPVMVMGAIINSARGLSIEKEKS